MPKVRIIHVHSGTAGEGPGPLLEAFSAMAERIAAMPHLHQCGHGGVGRLEIRSEGCGHVWTHANVPAEKYDEAHACPKCGMGPWFVQYEPDTRFVATLAD